MGSKKRLKQQINELTQQKAELEKQNADLKNQNILKEQEIVALIQDVEALKAENMNSRMVIDNLANKLQYPPPQPQQLPGNNMMILLMMLFSQLSQKSNIQQNPTYAVVNPFVQNNMSFFPGGQLNIGASSPFNLNNNFTNIANNNFLAPVSYQNQFNMPITSFAPRPLVI